MGPWTAHWKQQVRYFLTAWAITVDKGFLPWQVTTAEIWMTPLLG